MRKVEALIRPFELDEVKDNLGKIGIHNITVVDVRSSSHEREEDPELYLGDAGYVIEFMPKVKIEVMVDKEKAEAVAKAILKSSRNVDKKGQNRSRVFIYDIEKVIQAK